MKKCLVSRGMHKSSFHSWPAEGATCFRDWVAFVPDQGLSQYFPAQGIPLSLQSDLKWSSRRGRLFLGKQPSLEECQSAACPSCDQLGNTPASYNRNSVHLCLEGFYSNSEFLNSAEKKDCVFGKVFLYIISDSHRD